jgi:hypothetical protein
MPVDVMPVLLTSSLRRLVACGSAIPTAAIPASRGSWCGHSGRFYNANLLLSVSMIEVNEENRLVNSIMAID